MRKFLPLLLLSLVWSCKNNSGQETITNTDLAASGDISGLIYPEETHFKSLRQVTFGGDNAEAYWSFDNSTFVDSNKSGKKR